MVGSGVGIYWISAFGATEATLFSAEGLGLALRIDPLSITMYTMISIIAIMVVRFSRNYLDGEPRIKQFFSKLAFTLAFVQLLVISGNLATLFVAWVGTSIGLHQLLRFYPNRKKSGSCGSKEIFSCPIGRSIASDSFHPYLPRIQQWKPYAHI